MGDVHQGVVPKDDIRLDATLGGQAVTPLAEGLVTGQGVIIGTVIIDGGIGGGWSGLTFFNGLEDVVGVVSK